ncbi:MAG: guanylate kinase [Mycoplasma sp.]|nr:guanylate kinase [Candidatus Hennigella equi]
MLLKKGKLIVICGPSGAGKKTVWSGIIDQKKYNTIFSISMTTRNRRPGEKEGVDYFYVSKKKFENAINKKKMLEWAIYVNNYYGTPRKFVRNNLLRGKNVFLEIEMQGVLQILKNWKKKKRLITIFIAPPSITELEKRLRNRRTEPEIIVKQRLLQAKWELTQKNLFKYVIVNDSVTKAKKRLTSILNKELLNK